MFSSWSVNCIMVIFIFFGGKLYNLFTLRQNLSCIYHEREPKTDFIFIFIFLRKDYDVFLTGTSLVKTGIIIYGCEIF